ncbi:hypothetical protein V8E36_004112 [Tilletia maclaganii]
MLSSVRKFSFLLLSLTLALTVLSLLPGAVDGADAKSLCSSRSNHSLKQRKHKHIAAHQHKHKHHDKSKKHKGSSSKVKSLSKATKKNRKHKQKKTKHHHHKDKKAHGKHKHKSKSKVGKKHKKTKPQHTSKQAAPNNLVPFGLKAGITGEDGLEALGPYIGSYSNWKAQPWSPNPPTDVLYMPMVWGAGTSSSHDHDLLHSFKALYGPGSSSSRRAAPPKVVIGFEEPDCPTGNGSSGVSVSTGARIWNEIIGPLRKDGTILVSPSMCKQTDEDWLTPFKAEIDVHWDVTNVHVNQDNVEDVKREIDYYWNKYRKPIYVTELACVHVKPSWNVVTNQQLINRYIRDVVEYFESDDRVAVYQYSTGMGLADQWRLTEPGTKELTESGRVYRDAIKQYAGGKSNHVGISRRSLELDSRDEAESLPLDDEEDEDVPEEDGVEGQDEDSEDGDDVEPLDDDDDDDVLAFDEDI